MGKLPQKGQKSSITQLIQTRYSKACKIITTNVHPTQWVADAVLIDGMFLISHLSMGKPQDHVRLCQLPLKTAHSTTLCLRGKGSTPLFDHPGRYPNSPKYLKEPEGVHRLKALILASTLMKQHQYQGGSKKIF